MHINTTNAPRLIDLGAASKKTMGGCTGIFELIGMILPLGLSRD